MRFGSCGRGLPPAGRSSPRRGPRRGLPGLLLTLALTLISACGSRSSLVERGTGFDDGSGGAGASSGGTTTSGGGRSTGGTGTGGGAGSGGGGGDACPDEGARACHEDDVKQTRVCSRGSWQSDVRCRAAWNCDPASGTCALIVPECADLSAGDRYCAPGDELMECGPNLLSSALIETCSGRCVSMGSSAACAPASCGDGKLQPDEACDDGNFASDDACTELCQPPICGDGFVGPAEDCDDGNVIDGDECPLDCVLEVMQLTAMSAHSCALHEGGQVKCWGNNGYGQLGVGDQEWRGDDANEMGDSLPALDLGTGRTAQLVAVGWNHACAVLDDGSVKCWGNNSYGELGLGHTDRRGDAAGDMGDALPAIDLGTGRTAKTLALGVGQSCAVLDDGSVKCWGYNEQGQLGLGDQEWRGDDPNEMGDALPRVELGTGRTAKGLAAGTYHTCALLDDDSVKCWGTNNEGQLGLGDEEWRGDAPGEMGDALLAVDLGLGRSAQAISVGHGFSCAVLDDASVKCWGISEVGQLGQGDESSRGDDAGEMGEALRAIDLGLGRFARALSVGTYHACALLDDASIKCWGLNEYGTLGIGDTTSRGNSAGEMGDALPAVALGSDGSATGLAAGGHHVCALLHGGRVKCWGANDLGQLGQGDTDERGSGPGEMGDALLAIDFW